MGTKTAKSWTCRGCGEQNDPLDRVCSKCGGDGRAAIAGAFIGDRLQEAGIPETQAEAALKEAAVDGKGREIKVAFSKGAGFEATLHISGSGEAWRIGWDFRCKAAGESSRDPDTYACEEAAAAAGFERLKLWLAGVRESTPSLASKVRKAIAEAGIHEARAIGAWLKEHKVGFQSPKKAAAPTASKPAVPLAARVNAAPVVHLDLARIQPSPENMRTDFDEASLQELADSIKSHGLGQPIMVVAVGEAWELIAGERRYRASKLAKLTSIPARVIDCSPAEARELRLIENLKRKDLSAIEEARGYQTLLQENGYTQKALGEKLGVDQSTIANRIRLLRLPAALQELIIRREIPESHGRNLVAYAELPTVLEHFAKAIKEQIRDEGLPSLRDWPGWLHTTACEVLRDVEPKSYYSYEVGNRYFSGYVLFTEKQLEKWKDELQIVELKNPFQKRAERYAANVKRWEELHGELVKAKAERDAAEAASSRAKPKAGKTSADVAARADQLAKQFRERTRKYWQRWVQQVAAVRTETMTDDKLVRLLIGFAGMDDSRGRRGNELVTILKTFGGEGAGGHSYGGCRELLSVMTVQGKDLLDVGRAAVKQWIQHDVEQFDTSLRKEDLPALVELFAIDLGKEWRLDEAFLQLHTKDQLAALWKEWKIPGVPPEKRGDIVKAILAADQTKQVPAPKSLLKL